MTGWSEERAGYGLNPLTAALCAAALLGERLGPLQVVDGRLVLAGVALATVMAAQGDAAAARRIL